MSGDIAVAVVGADSPAGEAIVELIEARGLPVARLFALSADETERSVEFRGRHLPVRDLERFDFTQVGIVLVCVGVSTQALERMEAAGCTVVDAGGRLRQDPDVPLVAAPVNPERLAHGNRFALPDPLALHLARLLKPVADAAGLTRVGVTACRAVSAEGRRAIEALAGQTARLLNVQPLEPTVYEEQIAFNVLPGYGTPDAAGQTPEERAAADDLRRLLGDDALPVTVTALRVPVFFGDSLVVELQTRDPFSAEQMAELLAAKAGVELCERPTPVGEGANQDAVFVGRIRQDPSLPKGLSLWSVADAVRTGVALGSVEIAEILVTAQQ